MEKTDSLIEMLKGGDLRSTGNSGRAVLIVEKNPELLKTLILGMQNEDPVVRMRCADAAEKVSAKHPEHLKQFKSKLINEISKIRQQEVRWHVAQMFSYLDLTKEERKKAVAILLDFLNDKSSIVKTFSLQTLANLAIKDESIKPQALSAIKRMMRNGSPAVTSRGKKLIKILET